MKEQGFEINAQHFRTDDKVMNLLLKGFTGGKPVEERYKKDYENLLQAQAKIRRRFEKAMDKLNEVLDKDKMNAFRKELDKV